MPAIIIQVADSLVSRAAESTATEPLAASRTSVKIPANGPATRETLVAPILPLPALRTSLPPKVCATSKPKGMEPSRYATTGMPKWISCARSMLGPLQRSRRGMRARRGIDLRAEIGAQRRGLLRAVVQEMDAHHVQRGLRGLYADHFAVAGEVQAALLDAGSGRKRDMHGAHRLFFAAATRPGDSGDAYAQHAAGAMANAVGERGCHFGADRAFCGDQRSGHIGPRGFKFVAVADYAAKEIRGASGDAGEALGEEPAGAAFCCGDGGVVQDEQVRDHLVEGRAIAGEDAVG